jgi:RNA-splicing ligase RtcB
VEQVSSKFFNWGVDIGCGMHAVRTQFTAEDVRRIGNLAALREAIESRADRAELAASARVARLREPLHRGLAGRARPGVLFLHSGSRGVGNKLANKHIKVAVGLCQEAGHRGHVWLSRKGAIDASKGKLGLIPGSMGTASYVVEGLGNKLSLWSSPHGAGRNYSRSAALKTFTREQLDAAMEGIEWGRSDAFLDEIPGAYKPIDQIMADAADLVTIKHTLRQIVNVKGD